MKRLIGIILISGGFVGLFLIVFYFNENQHNEVDSTPQDNVSHNADSGKVTEIAKDDELVIGEMPISYDLAVPFTSQAPYSKWDLPYQEFCEEAALLMVHAYHDGFDLPDPATEDKLLNEIKTWEENHFGFYKDTTAEETAEILREMYGYKKVKVSDDVTVSNIKFQITNNRPVIIPSYGRGLGNPNFTDPGPLYHMLVVRGFNETHFITNDPGTRLGESFTYPYDVLISAAHDWNDGDVENGAKKIIIVYPN